MFGPARRAFALAPIMLVFALCTLLATVSIERALLLGPAGFQAQNKSCGEQLPRDLSAAKRISWPLVLTLNESPTFGSHGMSRNGDPAVAVPAHGRLIGAILFLSGLQMVRSAIMRVDIVVPPPERPPILGAWIAGGVTGFVSGMTGTGGRIFLAPVILSMNWVSMRRTAAVTAAYNLLNSGAALVGASRILGRRRRSSGRRPAGRSNSNPRSKRGRR
jgi:hypothetical protein